MYRPEIDGLRALAVIPVILFHAGFDLFSGGFVGVDVFFVISGYLITTNIIDDIEKDRFSIANFYERRARRLLPALFFVMLVCIPFALMWMLPSQVRDFSESLIAVSLFASNILFAGDSGYFAAAAEKKPLLHTWSLAVEEQYYLLFPIFLVLLWRLGKNKVFWIIAILAAISLLLSEWGWRNNATDNFYLAPTRAWELFAGSIAAFFAQKNGIQKNNPLAILGLVAIIGAIFAYGETTPFPSLYALAPVLGTVLLVLYAGEETLVAKLLSSRLFVGTGLISYSAYLWHQPLFAFARIRLVQQPSEVLLLTLSAASLGLAYLSWRFVEHPFRGRRILERKTVFILALGGMITFLTIGIIGYTTDGFLKLTTTQQYRDTMVTAAASPKRKACHTGRAKYLSYNESCEYFSDNIKVAVLGDSHTVELSYAIAEELRAKDIGLKHLSFSSCAPLWNVSPDDALLHDIATLEHCQSWTRQAVDGIINDGRIDTVILSYRLAYYLYGPHEEAYPAIIDERDEATREIVWGALLDIINDLEQAGKRTLFVMQSPELPRSIGYLIPKETDAYVAGVPLQWWKNRMSYVYQNLDELKAVTEVLDPAKMLCDEVTCYVMGDNKAFYFDDNHLSVEGARRIAQKIISRYFSQ